VIVLVFRVLVSVRVSMSGAVDVEVLVRVEDDFEVATEGIGDTAQRLETRHMIAAFQAADHRFGHAQARREVPLRFTRVLAQLDEFPGALRRKQCAVVGATSGFES
jgi:hypothetical protein